jgi:nitroreductase
MIIDKPAITSEPIHELLAGRWSPRAYDAGEAVTREQITSLLEAARWAPSCFGDEPWRFLVFDRARDPDNWRRACECLSEGNRKWASSAPLLIAALADSRYRSRDEHNRWAQYDAGAASMSLVLQAVALGLSAHQMGGFDRERLSASFGVPERFTPMAVIAIGYPGDPDQLPDDLQERELAERNRRPLSEIAFTGRWESPYLD